MRVMLIQLLSVVRKEMRQTFRDKRMLMLLTVAPVVQLTLLGFAVDLDIDRVPTVVSDQDHTPRSRALVRGLLADKTLVSVGRSDDPAGAVQRGKASVAIVVPRGLARDLVHGRPAQIQVLIDGSDPLRAQAAIDASVQQIARRAEQILRARVELAVQRQLLLAADPSNSTPLLSLPEPPPRVRVQARVYYNPQLRSPVYMVPGVAATVLLIVTTVITAMSIARERELGTIEQLMVTPMRPVVLLVGKVLPFAAVGIVVAGVVIAVGTNLFDVPIRGSLLVLLVGTVAYLLSTLGTGVFISTVSRSQQQAILGSFFFIMPAVLLGGFMSPVENMPAWAQKIALVNPVRYYLEILRGCMLKGAGFVDLARPLLSLLAFGVAIVALAALRFRKRLA
ncbi:MAG: ABC transporter permease [Myxococcales bacterium]|nr:ABC transporter permease [Myxococcales bacterium]